MYNKTTFNYSNERVMTLDWVQQGNTNLFGGPTIYPMFAKKSNLPLSEEQIRKNNEEYERQIVTLESLRDGIRETPGVYIGNIGNLGFINMIREVFQNSLDEIQKGKAIKDLIIVSYDERTHVTIIEDFGRGIPFSKLPTIFSSQHTSSNYNKNKGEYSSGRHGLGSKATCALSDKFVVQSYVYPDAQQITFDDGYVTGPPVTIKNPDKQGTIVEFHPQYSVMGPISVTCNDVLNLITSILPLMKIGATVEFNGILMNGQSVQQRIVNEDGIMTELILNVDAPIIKPISIFEDTGEMKLEAVFCYDGTKMSDNMLMMSYANFCPTKSDGTHVTGFDDALCRFFSNYMNKIYLVGSNGKKKKPLQVTFGDIRTGLVVVLHSCMLKPNFEGQAKDRLGNEEMLVFSKEVTTRALDMWAKNNPAELQKLCKYLKEVAEIRTKADTEKVKISTKFANSSLSGGLPPKYIEPTGTEDLELIIVEGDSAQGSARNSRDKRKQGIYPIRGKMPNPVNTTRAKYLANEEVRGIIAILSDGKADPNNLKAYDWSKCKYKRIIIMADADFDGYHIRTLLFKLFLYYLPILVLEGRVFAAVPPLYGLKNNKNEVVQYFTTKLDYVNFLMKSFSKQNTVQDLSGADISSKDVGQIIYNNADYTYLVDVLRRRYALDPTFLEYTVMSLIKAGLGNDTKAVFKSIKKDIEKEYRFVNVYMENGIIILDGIINYKSNTIILSPQFYKDVAELVTMVQANYTQMDYVLNGEHCRLYTLMMTYEKSSPGNIIRYKGLGEMNPDQLAQSTLRPDADRLLIQYVLDDEIKAKNEINYLESDKKRLLAGTVTGRRDLMG